MSIPLNGCGKGVGTGPPGDGIMMIWVSMRGYLIALFGGWLSH